MTVYRFDHWRFDSDSGELIGDDGSCDRLRPQTALVLRQLLKASPRIITREQLRDALWPGNTIVDFDTGINGCIRQIRQVLGETAAAPRYLHTVPKRGFHWRGEVAREKQCEDVIPAPAAASSVAAHGLPVSWPALIGALAVILAVSVIALQWAATQRPFTVLVMPFDAPAEPSPGAREFVQAVHTQLVYAIGRADEAMHVVPRRSSLAVADSASILTAGALGARFDADLIVEGSVQSGGSGYVVAISIVDPRADRFLWGEIVEVETGQQQAGIAHIVEIALDTVRARRTAAAQRDE